MVVRDKIKNRVDDQELSQSTLIFIYIIAGFVLEASFFLLHIFPDYGS